MSNATIIRSKVITVQNVVVPYGIQSRRNIHLQTNMANIDGKQRKGPGQRHNDVSLNRQCYFLIELDWDPELIPITRKGGFTMNGIVPP